MRAISEPVKSYSQTLGSSLLVQPSQQLPNFGPVLGLWLDDDTPVHNAPPPTDLAHMIDLSKIHFVGLYPNYAKAKEAWKSAAQSTVDNAHMRYFVVHLHKLLQPELLADAGTVKAAPSKAATTKAKSTAKKAGKAGARK